MGSSLKYSPYWGSVLKGAVMYWGPKEGPYFRDHIKVHGIGVLNTQNKLLWCIKV